MAFEMQYRGIESGWLMGYETATSDAADAWPGATLWFTGFELFFGSLFTIEVLLKMMVMKKEFFRSGWNLFDMVIVTVWLVEQGMSEALAINAMIFRMMRLFKLGRLARMVKKAQAFDSLQVLMGSIIASGPVLVWSAMVMILCQMVAGMFLNSMLVDFMRDETKPVEDRREVYRYFGTFTRAMLTMFELTLSNWMAATRVLQDNVNEWFGLFMVCYKLTVGFAVVKVISGVFLHETFRVAASDDDLMIMQKRRAMEKHKTKMMKLLREADESSDNLVTRGELNAMLSDPNMKIWLAAQDVEVNDADILFDFLDNGDNTLSAEELVGGIARLKGTARSIDMNAVVRMLCHIDGMLVDLDDRVEDMDRRWEESRTKM
eukprot:NODE_504_length_1516_cov_311.971253.p1 GENE.NODE_504_length_1516_cov_311.971253~~NODE_504_length_1516_cov_311.971253.p1  ORF type:complete len:442 (-),score=157.22 NODE_504_length_1516_cov_311.971253:177-1304(-)